MHSPGSQHWKAVKRIFCYLSGTIHLGLFYPRGDHCRQIYMRFQTLIGLVAMTQECPQVVFVSCSVAHAYLWLSKKQPTVATSSCEAEYRATFTTTVECVWLQMSYG